MSSTNFLPEYSPGETPTGGRNTLQCIKRGKAVPATPEERVRQRILRWLQQDKQWPVQKIELENGYSWIGDAGRSHIRPDIELLDDNGDTLVVVVCKAPEIPLGPAVEKQALEYAIKSNAGHVWISNGDQHKFLVRSSRGTWNATSELKPLGAEYAPPMVNFAFPDANDQEAVERYFDESFPDQGYTILDQNDQWIVLSIHKLLFDMDKRESLPFSFKGVHVLEDRGAGFHEFRNAGGGKWRNLYGDYIAATSGRVEAMSVAVYRWGGEGGGIRLCVGVRKAGRSHHALQMDLKDCEWVEERGCWEVYHDGRMSQIRNATVFAAVEESGAGDWLEKAQDYLYLGDLPWVENACLGKLQGVACQRAALRDHTHQSPGREPSQEASRIREISVEGRGALLWNGHRYETKYGQSFGNLVRRH